MADAASCTTVTPPVWYRVTVLRVPDMSDASAGVPLGLDIDQQGEVCGVPDLPGDVDNALAQFVYEDPNAPTPFFPEDGATLQDMLDAGLACAEGDPSCLPLELRLTVTSGAGCALVQVFDGDDDTPDGPFAGTFDGDGRLRFAAEDLSLGLRYPAEQGGQPFTLALAGLQVEATVTEAGLTDLVVGGVLGQAVFEAVLVQILAAIHSDFSLDDLRPVLAGLYDVQLGSSCDGLSVGFLGMAAREPAP